ncbi:hypothetical protein H0H93_008267 [Arthromyces matolae]|nr:hypothetical protein H0H93_008267 [Arthromyces matolae]
MDSAIKFWFGMTYAQLESKFSPVGIVDMETMRELRSTTAKRALPLVDLDRPLPPAFAVPVIGSQHLPTLPPDDGSDIDVDEMRDSPEPELTIDQLTTIIWGQFLIDVAAKSPNPEGIHRASYVRLTDVQRRNADETLFRNLNLPDIFNDVAFKSADHTVWERVFKWFFPPRGMQTSSKSQYTKCPYYLRWKALANREDLSDDTVATIRQELWRRLRTLAWIPDAQQDKMWTTSAVSGFRRWPDRRHPSGKSVAAPRILLRTGCVATFEVNNHVDERHV